MGGIGGFPAGDFNLSNVQHLPASWIYAILDQARKDIEDQGIALKSGPLTDAVLEEMVGVALIETAGGGGDDGTVDVFAESAAAKGPFQFTPQTWIEVSGNSDDPTWPGPYGKLDDSFINGGLNYRFDVVMAARAALLTYDWTASDPNFDSGWGRWEGHPEGKIRADASQEHIDAVMALRENWPTALEYASDAASTDLTGFDTGLFVVPDEPMGPNAVGGSTTKTVTDVLSGSGYFTTAGEAIESFSDGGKFFKVVTPPPTLGPGGQGSDAEFYVKWYYVLPVGGDATPADDYQGTAVYWRLDHLPSFKPDEDHTMDQATWDRLYGGSASWLATGDVITNVDGRFTPEGMFMVNQDTSGSEEDLVPIDEMLRQLEVEAFLAGTDALNDPGVQYLIARVIANPVLMEAMEYIQGEIDLTAWGQSRSDLRKNYDRATAAQKEAIVRAVLEDTKSGLYQQFQYYTSTFGDPADDLVVGGKTMREWATEIAMGTSTYWDVGNAIKTYANNQEGDNAWKIHVRDTEIAGGQYEMDTESKIGELRDIYASWGLAPDEYSWDLKDLAQELLTNKISMVEVMDDIRETAMEKFPGKPKLVKTSEWAQPWLNMYDTEMPTPAGDFSNSDIMTAIQTGESPGDFRTTLRKKDEWQKSPRAKMIAADVMRSVGDTFGFNRGGGIH